MLVAIKKLIEILKIIRIMPFAINMDINNKVYFDLSCLSFSFNYVDVFYMKYYSMFRFNIGKDISNYVINIELLFMNFKFTTKGRK